MKNLLHAGIDVDEKNYHVSIILRNGQIETFKIRAVYKTLI